ncbi:MAG: DNA oxidative demethylase AlkB [Rhodopseudomonas sp.]|uniref:DNA oxidative demethylase AlkB n=1 Tax=Rhodopseudomonas sp. TaxID=1078 RepID=UPI00184A7CA1|nr:DNA oxidative demethylase AlkB [Rhodopseudomonas sp.]NVN87726.1 DNA oxidative demethylase AlkB [Rhodopseudomonas sp.]
MNDLFDSLPDLRPVREQIAEGAVLLRGLARDGEADLIAALRDVVACAPFRHMQTPGGHRMSVAMTNCGAVGWVTDRSGYRYAATDPDSGQPWPAMPAPLRDLALRAAVQAGFPGFDPDACLINRYRPGAKMALHQDKDEQDFGAPIVSVSLGLPATFLFGGMARSDKPLRLALTHGDVVAWGGPARLAYHGVAPLKDGTHPLLGPQRINLTFRKAR